MFLIPWWTNMVNLSPTHRQLNCCQFCLNLSLKMLVSSKGRVQICRWLSLYCQASGFKADYYYDWHMQMDGHTADVWGLDDNVTWHGETFFSRFVAILRLSSSCCHLTARLPPTYKVGPFSGWAVDTGCLLLRDNVR